MFNPPLHCVQAWGSTKISLSPVTLFKFQHAAACWRYVMRRLLPYLAGAHHTSGRRVCFSTTWHLSPTRKPPPLPLLMPAA